MDDPKKLREITDIKVIANKFIQHPCGQGRSSLPISLLDSIFSVLNRILPYRLAPFKKKKKFIFCLFYHSWKQASFWKRRQRACVCIFSCMPSVHRMDYSCLQLKSRLSWPRVRREASASCLTAKTFFPSLQDTNVTSAIRTWVS